ncbi:MAG: hypothetical protein ACJ763_10190 [Bdellovibrionia bacterium]
MNTESQKTPGADLWMYHTYSWRPLSTAPASAESELQLRQRADQNLTDRGFIRVPSSGNPDLWIDEKVTSQSIGLEFTDAHTGSVIWKGRSVLKPGHEQLTENTLNGSIDHLISQYIAAQNWMPASFWWKGIDQVGS